MEALTCQLLGVMAPDSSGTLELPSAKGASPKLPFLSQELPTYIPLVILGRRRIEALWPQSGITKGYPSSSAPVGWTEPPWLLYHNPASPSAQSCIPPLLTDVAADTFPNKLCVREVQYWDSFPWKLSLRHHLKQVGDHLKMNWILKDPQLDSDESMLFKKW